MRRMYGWATRITDAEVAARNRRARFPAARYGGVLRIASAADPARARMPAGEDLTTSTLVVRIS